MQYTTQTLAPTRKPDSLEPLRFPDAADPASDRESGLEAPRVRRSDQPHTIDIRELTARVTGSARFDDPELGYAAGLKQRLAGMLNA